MVKRGKISFSGAADVFRVSKPGVDVDTAAPDQLLLDERVFYGQLYAAGYMANTSPSTAHSQTVEFTSIGFPPLAICFPVVGTSIVYPSRYQYKAGLGGAIVGAAIYSTTETTLVYEFSGDPSETGFYYMIFRRAR